MERETTLEHSAEESELSLSAEERPPEKKRFKFNAEEVYGTLFAAIPLIGFAIFGLVPLILAAAMAFLDLGYGWDLSEAQWVGFDNFVYLFTRAEEELGLSFFDALLNTLLLGISTFISQILALGIAYLLSRDIKGRGVWRIIYFIPYVCSVVAITLMWRYIFDPGYGIVNQLLGNTDISEGAIDWTGDPTVFYVTLNIISVWSGMGYGILLYTAALTNVNQSSVEAAKIDGAGPFMQFFKIVLPTISPTTFYLLIMGVIGMLQSFAMSNVFDATGGPDKHGITIVFFMYQYMFDPGWTNVGVASAASWLLAALIFLVTGIQFIGSRRWVKYD